MSVAALAVAVSALAIYVVAEQALRSQIADRVSRNSEALIASTASGVPSTAFGFGVGNADGPAVKVALVTTDGELITFTNASAPFTDADGTLDEPEAAVVRGESSESLREVRGYMMSAERTPAGETVLVAESMMATSPLMSKLTVALIVIGGFLVALAGVAAAAVARTGLRPVRRLRSAAERVARTGDFDPIVVNGDDELASLAASFNEMLDALSRSRSRQGQLIVDAGAELMAPLTALRTDIDLLMSLDRPGSPALSWEEQDALRRDIITSMDVITGLIHELVDHAREPATGP